MFTPERWGIFFYNAEEIRHFIFFLVVDKDGVVFLFFRRLCTFGLLCHEVGLV